MEEELRTASHLTLHKVEVMLMVSVRYHLPVGTTQEVPRVPRRIALNEVSFMRKYQME